MYGPQAIIRTLAFALKEMGASRGLYIRRGVAQGVSDKVVAIIHASTDGIFDEGGYSTGDKKQLDSGHI